MIQNDLSPVLNKFLHAPSERKIVNETTLCSSTKPKLNVCLNEDLDFSAIEIAYMKSKIVVVDDFLVSSCLEKLRNYALSATVWHSTKVGGYLGTYIYDGFTPSVLHMLARELEEALPKVFDYGRHSLEMAWAYKYFLTV